MASKYIFAINKKHIFNPVAFGVAICALTFNQSANWWAGRSQMFVLVLILGLLIVRKIRRFDLVFYFFFTSFCTILLLSLLRGSDFFTIFTKTLLDTPILFFAFVMVTEPLTTPPTKLLQSIYGALVGVMFAPQFHLGPIFFTPETALLAGNVFSFIVSPKEKLMIILQQKIQVGADIYDFVFEKPHPVNYKPGQYMEWTLGNNKADDRGNRRYFTLASSPTENNLRIGVKTYKGSSTYKQQLVGLNVGDSIVAGNLAGDFTLPKDLSIKLVFIAGGIGVTPFRSIIKYLVDKGEKRDVVMFFANKKVSDIVYKDIFDQAQSLGVKTVYLLDSLEGVPAGSTYMQGFITDKVILQEVPDYKERIFYISGPNAMVMSYKNLLKKMGIKENKIVTDYFPGF